jgi:hypothetical protein
VTVDTSVPPAVDMLSTTSEPENPATGEEKLTVKSIGEIDVGSGWPTAWLIVTLRFEMVMPDAGSTSTSLRWTFASSTGTASRRRG